MIILLKLIIVYCLIKLILNIWSFSYKQRLILSNLRKLRYEQYLKYKINDHTELDISITIVFLYFIFFIVLLFISRLKNTQRLFDISLYYNKLCYFLISDNIIMSITNIIIFILLVILYLKLLSLFIKNVKKHFMKLYFYCILNLLLKYEFYVLHLIIKISFDRYTIKFSDKILSKDPQKTMFAINQFIHYHLLGLEFIIHRIILLCVVYYDIKYNNMILTHMFKILPYVFLYELRVKIYTFLLERNLQYDKIVSRLLYGKITYSSEDHDHLYLDDEPYEKKSIKEIILTYASNNFTSKSSANNDFNLLCSYWRNIFRNRILKKYALIDIIVILLIIIFVCII